MRHYPTAEIVFDVLLQSSDALRYPMYFLCLSSVFMGTLVFTLLTMTGEVELTSHKLCNRRS